MTTNSSERSAAWIVFPVSVALRRARGSSINARLVYRSTQCATPPFCCRSRCACFIATACSVATVVRSILFLAVDAGTLVSRNGGARVGSKGAFTALDQGQVAAFGTDWGGRGKGRARLEISPACIPHGRGGTSPGSAC